VLLDDATVDGLSLLLEYLLPVHVLDLLAYADQLVVELV
jgi:hypothetical protein